MRSFVFASLLLAGCGGLIAPTNAADDASPGSDVGPIGSGGDGAGANDSGVAIEADSSPTIDTAPAVDASALPPIHADGYDTCTPSAPFSSPSAPCADTSADLGGLCAEPETSVACDDFPQACKQGEDDHVVVSILYDTVEKCAGRWDGAAWSVAFNSRGCVTNVAWQDMPRDVAQCFVDAIVHQRFACETASSTGITAGGACSASDVPG